MNTVTVSIPEDSNEEIVEYDGSYSNVASFDELDQRGGLEVISHTLVDDKEEDRKTWLRGMYFIITRLVYREGNYLDGYVSCEAVVATDDRFDECLKRQQNAELNERFPGVEQTRDMLPGWLYPGARIVFNDGSTGIRNQCTEMIASMKVPLIKVPIPKQGAHRWSVLHTEWEILRPDCVETRVKVDGEQSTIVHALPGKDFSIKCYRGLRSSGYQWDEKLGRAVDGQGQRTYYLS